MFGIVNQFSIKGNIRACECFGNGHINDTYRIETDAPHTYILQRINHNVFRNVPALMQNIVAVTQHISTITDDPRHVLTLVPLRNGEMYLYDAMMDGYFRMYEYITGSLCLQRPETPFDFFQSGVAFGRFQQQLSSFPAHTLSEPIERFHDTKKRYADFHAACKQDAKGYAASLSREIDFALAHEEEAGIMVDMLQKGQLPLRVTHNDTKLNNVMLDEKTREALCVIDLDTVMPGLAGNDFGDSIRFGASTAVEDEQDLTKVSLSMPLFTVYAQGFLEACGCNLTENEVMTLPLGAKLMTLECGIRFLADHLAGDVYFHVARPGHNLDRCRTQFALIADMEKKWEEMMSTVEKAWKHLCVAL